MEKDELFRRLAVALAISLLIGLERGWQAREEAEDERTAGRRYRGCREPVYPHQLRDRATDHGPLERSKRRIRELRIAERACRQRPGCRRMGRVLHYV